jgi:hypothetical protein
MAKITSREKRRAERLRIMEKRRQAEQELEEELVEEDELLEEPVEKAFDDTDYRGPTSWEEAEEVQKARMAAQRVREATWTAEELVRNILNRGDLTPQEKGKAIANVGEGFGDRITEIASMRPVSKSHDGPDMDLLELRALRAIDRRSMGIVEKVGDWLTKAKADLTDDDYALVDGETRLYPICDKAHLRKSLADIQADLEKGVDERAREALPLVLKAARDFEIGASSPVWVRKDATGNWRAVLWPSNNFIDRDGDIISDAAHREYVEWVNKNMDAAPVFATWHTAGTARTHQVDFVGYENGFVIESCPLTESEAAALLKMQEQIDVGLSIGAFGWRDPKDENVVLKYRKFENSDLPLEKASNPFTEFQVLTKEADVDTLKYLTGILGDENLAQNFIKKAGLKQAELRKVGLTEKAQDEEPVTEPETTSEPVVAAEPKVELSDIVAQVAKEFGMEDLSEQFALLKEKADKVDALELVVKELAKSKDEQLAEMIAPPAAKKFAWMNKARASQSKETELDEKDESDTVLKKSGPEYWLSEATGTQPIAQ